MDKSRDFNAIPLSTKNRRKMWRFWLLLIDGKLPKVTHPSSSINLISIASLESYNERGKNADDGIVWFEKTKREALEEWMERKREKKQECTEWAVAIAQLFVVVVTMMMMTRDGPCKEIMIIHSFEC